VTYPLTSIQAPLANGVTLVLGNFSTNAVLYSGSFSLNREINPRVALTGAGGHLGFVPRGRQPEAKIVLETTALTGSPFTAAGAFDPYKLEEVATGLAFSLRFGTVQYNKWLLEFLQAQVIGSAPTVVNGVACTELTIRANTSTPVAADDIRITFD
ncbi:MAG TPA: hypothetical protein VGQ24_02620, partial [Gemmatimonadales bacterium]|nr:hypothetical protein [Gemmatimonadales bacterium]